MIYFWPIWMVWGPSSKLITIVIVVRIIKRTTKRMRQMVERYRIFKRISIIRMEVLSVDLCILDVSWNPTVMPRLCANDIVSADIWWLMYFGGDRLRTWMADGPDRTLKIGQWPPVAMRNISFTSRRSPCGKVSHHFGHLHWAVALKQTEQNVKSR